jgi:hypothetical protein
MPFAKRADLVHPMRLVNEGLSELPWQHSVRFAARPHGVTHAEIAMPNPSRQ